MSNRPMRFVSGLLLGLWCLALTPAVPAAAPTPREGMILRDGRGDPLPLGAIARLGTVRLRHPRQNCAAFSPDSKILASAGDDRVVRLWDVATGRELRRMEGHRFNIRALVYASDGKTVISAGVYGEVRVWDTATGRQLHFMEGNRATVFSLGLSRDGRTLAMISDNGYVHLWDPTTGKLLRNFRVAASPLMMPCLALSPDGKLLATGGPRVPILLWEARTGKELREVDGTPYGASSLAFTADRKHLVCGSWDGTVRLKDVSTGKEVRKLDKVRGSVLSLVRTPGGRERIAAAGSNNDAGVWDLSTGDLVARVTAHASRPVSFLALSPNGKRLVTGTIEDSALRLWDVTTGRELLAGPGHHYAIETLAFSPRDGTIATGGRDGVFIWEASGKVVRRLSDFKHDARALAFSPDGKVLATGSWHYQVDLWDASGKYLRACKRQDFWVSAVAFAPDGKTFASSGHKEVLLWETDTGKEVGRLGGHQLIGGLAFAPDGKTLAVAVNNGIRLWNLRGGKEGRTLQGHKGPVTAVAFEPASRDGATPALLASAGWDQTVRLWNIANGHNVAVLTGHKSRVTSVAFSPDGRLLASGDQDQMLRLWEVATGGELVAVRPHAASLRSVAFSPDGSRLASGSDDTTALVWDVTTLPWDLPSPPLATKREIETLWDHLADKDARRGYGVIRALAAVPELAVPLIRKKMVPEVPATIKRLLIELDCDTFAAREAASAALEKLGEAARPGLNKTLAKSSSSVVRERVQQLLAKLDTKGPSPLNLRWLRAITVLERANTSEARKVLKAIAEDPPQREIGQNAHSALSRLARKAAGQPQP